MHQQFKSLVDLKKYISQVNSEEITKEIEQADTIESLLQPYMVTYGHIHNLILDKIKEINKDFHKARIIYFLQMFVLFAFFMFANYSENVFSIDSLKALNYVILPIVVLYLCIAKIEIEIFYGFTNASILKEQILVASLIFDSFFNKPEVKDKCEKLSIELTKDNFAFIKQLSETTYVWFHNETSYNNKIKSFVFNNYDKYTILLTSQFNTMAFFAENFKAVKKHTIR